MDLKYNINKIHGDLINNFKTVSIKEKSNLKFGNYFEISTKNEGMEVRMILTKKDLELNNIKWSYFSNPLNENSDLVERTSNIDNITDDVRDVISKKRFDSDYLSETEKENTHDLDWIYKLINELIDDSYDCECKKVDNVVVCSNDNTTMEVEDNGQPNDFYLVKITKDGVVTHDFTKSEDETYSPDEMPSDNIAILLAKCFQKNN